MFVETALEGDTKVHHGPFTKKSQTLAVVGGGLGRDNQKKVEDKEN